MDISLNSEDAYKAMETMRPYHLPGGGDEFMEILDDLSSVLRGLAAFGIDEDWWTLYGVYKRNCEALLNNPGTPEFAEEIRKRYYLQQEGKLEPDPDQWFPSSGKW